MASSFPAIVGNQKHIGAFALWDGECRDGEKSGRGEARWEGTQMIYTLVGVADLWNSIILAHSNFLTHKPLNIGTSCPNLRELPRF